MCRPSIPTLRPLPCAAGELATAALFLAALAGALPCQAGWSGGPVTGGPTNRSSAAMAFDANRGQLVMFGGRDFTGYPADTWVRSGSAPSPWVNVPTPAGPSARMDPAMAFDPIRGGVVLHGGWAPGGELGDGWWFDGSTWHPLQGPQPSARRDAAMAEIPGIGVVLFGGRLGNAPLGDLWLLTGSGWSPLSPSGPAPAPRYSHGLAWDGLAGQLVLAGGRDGSGNLQDAWRLPVLGAGQAGGVGLGWQLMPAAGAVPAGEQVVLCMDPFRERLVAVCMALRGSGMLRVAEWDGATWSPMPGGSVPGVRVDAALAHDPSRQEVVMFGGRTWFGPLGDSWQWASAQPAGLEDLAAGCAGSQGEVELAVAPGGWPWIGDEGVADLVNAPPGPGAAVAIFGYRAWQPVDLAGYGAPGCLLQVAPDELDVFGWGVGEAPRYRRFTGTAPSLTGLRIDLQVVVVDPLAGNAAGASLSRAYRVQLGIR